MPDDFDLLVADLARLDAQDAAAAPAKARPIRVPSKVTVPVKKPARPSAEQVSVGLDGVMAKALALHAAGGCTAAEVAILEGKTEALRALAFARARGGR